MQNYSFYLFSKLFDVYHPNETSYDELFGEVCTAYDLFIESALNDGNKPEYECMCNFLAEYVPSEEIYKN